MSDAAPEHSSAASGATASPPALVGRTLLRLMAADDIPAGARLGQALQFVFAALPLVTVWALEATEAERLRTVLVAVAAAVIGWALGLLPWSRLPRRALLLFPGVGLIELAVIGRASQTVATAYVGLVVLVYVFIGLTQPRGTSVLSVPVTAATWVLMNDAWSGVLAVRLAIAVMIWVAIGELLGDRTARLWDRTRSLARQAEYDPLTGLRNRRHLNSEMEALLPGDIVVLVDLDHFKRVNDEQGHAAGDEVLAAFTGLVSSLVRAHDSAVRYGGEEVLLLLRNTNVQGARSMLGRLRDSWQSTSDVTFSAGVAEVGGNGEGRRALRAADEALYAAKDAGRDRICVARDPVG